MSYVITNGNNYIKVNANGRVSAVADAHSAKTFPDRIKAETFCVCLPNAYRKLNYYATEYNPPETSRQAESKPEPVKYAPLIPSATELDEKAINLEYILEEVKHFEDLVILLQAQRKQIEQERNHTEAQIVDVEHIAEFCDKLSAPKAYKIYKALRDARVRRRQCKNSLDAFQYIGDVIPVHTITQRQMSKSIEGILRREFAPRALPNLYHELCESEDE